MLRPPPPSARGLPPPPPPPRRPLQVFGSFWPVVAATAFFLGGTLLQRVLAEPVARLVYSQEAAEGNYRWNSQLPARAGAPLPPPLLRPPPP